MKTLNLIFLLAAVYACSATYSPLSYTERPCGSNLNNLWLDVVAVVDNSVGMTKGGLDSIIANLQSVFVSANQARIGTRPNEPRTTRLGLVTYNQVATIKADLNKYQSVDDLYSVMPNDIGKVSTSTISTLETGLSMAEQVLKNGRNDGSNRGNYKQVALVYASSYSGNGEDTALPVAQRLKADGAKIITVAYGQKDDVALIGELSKIASPRFNFTNVDQIKLIPDIQTALFEANCFCPNDWFQYRDVFQNYLSPPYGSCVQPVGFPANWLSARGSCSRRAPTAHLASEFSQAKHNFIFAAVQNTTGFTIPYSYHIGLNFNDAGWTWDQPDGWQQPPITGHFDNWRPGYPSASPSKSAGLNYQSGANTYWVNEGQLATGANYVCEMYSCDTENFCAASDGSA